MNLIQNINMRLGVGESTQYLTTFENIELLCNKPPHNNWLIGLINFVKFFQDKNIQKIVDIVKSNSHPTVSQLLSEI